MRRDCRATDGCQDRGFSESSQTSFLLSSIEDEMWVIYGRDLANALRVFGVPACWITESQPGSASSEHSLFFEFGE